MPYNSERALNLCIQLLSGFYPLGGANPPPPQKRVVTVETIVTIETTVTVETTLTAVTTVTVKTTVTAVTTAK